MRALPTGNGSFWFYLEARRQSIGNEYRAKIRIDMNGNVSLGLRCVVGSVERPVIAETQMPA